MSTQAPGYARRPEEPSCYNCGGLGHWAVACPEPTRQTPAGLAAWRSGGTPSHGQGHHQDHRGHKKSKGPIITRYGPPPTPANHYPPPSLHYPPPSHGASGYPHPPPPSYPSYPQYPPSYGPPVYTQAQQPPPPPLPPPSYHAGPPHSLPHLPPASRDYVAHPRQSHYSAPPPGYGRHPPPLMGTQGFHPPPPPPPPPTRPPVPFSRGPNHLPPQIPAPPTSRAKPKPPLSKSVPLPTTSGIVLSLPPKPPPSKFESNRDRPELQQENRGKTKKKKNNRGRRNRENRQKEREQQQQETKQPESETQGTIESRRNEDVKSAAQEDILDEEEKTESMILSSPKSEVAQSLHREPEVESGETSKEQPESPGPQEVEDTEIAGPPSEITDGDSAWEWDNKTIFPPPEDTHSPDEVAKPLPADYSEDLMLPRKWDATCIESEFVTVSNLEEFIRPIHETMLWEEIQFDPAFSRDGKFPSGEPLPRLSLRPSSTDLEKDAKKGEHSLDPSPLGKQPVVTESNSPERQVKRKRTESPPSAQTRRLDTKEKRQSDPQWKFLDQQSQRVDSYRPGERYREKRSPSPQRAARGRVDRQSRDRRSERDSPPPGSRSRASSASSQSSGLDSLEAELLGISGKKTPSPDPERSRSPTPRTKRRRQNHDPAYSRRW